MPEQGDKADLRIKKTYLHISTGKYYAAGTAPAAAKLGGGQEAMSPLSKSVHSGPLTNRQNAKIVAWSHAYPKDNK